MYYFGLLVLIATAVLYTWPTTYAIHSGAQGSVYFNYYSIYILGYYSISDRIGAWAARKPWKTLNNQQSRPSKKAMGWMFSLRTSAIFSFNRVASSVNWELSIYKAPVGPKWPCRSCKTCIKVYQHQVNQPDLLITSCCNKQKDRPVKVNIGGHAEWMTPYLVCSHLAMCQNLVPL